MKHNICIFGLAAGFTKNVASRVATALEMNFACVEELIEFDIISSEEVKNICGAEYLKKIQQKKVRQVSSFENTLIYINYALLNDKVNLSQLKNTSLLTYISMDKGNFTRKTRLEKLTKLERILADGVFEDRHNILKNHADIEIDCSNKLPIPATKMVIDTIINYYKERL